MTHCLMLPVEITIYVASELRASWLQWLDGDAGDGPEAVADGHAVEEIDAAGLQCLLALSRSLEVRRQRLRLERPSDALHQACRRLGAGHLLAPPEGVSA